MQVRCSKELYSTWCCDGVQYKFITIELKETKKKRNTTGSDFSKFPKIRKQTDATKIHESFCEYKTLIEKTYSLRAVNRNSGLTAYTHKSYDSTIEKKICANCLKKVRPIFWAPKKTNNRKKNAMQLSCRFIVCSCKFK